MSNIDTTALRCYGHVLIRDAVSGEVLNDSHNAINIENFSEALALSLSNRATGHIYQMVFGNGGSSVSSIGTITYLPPNVVGQNAQLYNETFQKIVDDLSPLNLDSANNKMRVAHSVGLSYSDIQVTCTLEYSEPAGQLAFDNSPLTNNINPSGDSSFVAAYIFDEIGLKSYATSGEGRLLSHVIFHPIQKSLNRAIEVVYTIRLVVG